MALRVMTLNIWHDSGPWPERAKLIRAWIERLDPDLIGLQEVLRGPRLDQLAELVEGRGYHTDYAKATDFWNDRALDFGNAVASRWPISDREEIALPEGGDGERRVALSVTLAAPFGPLCFTTTHLNWKPHHGALRERQVVALCDLVLRRRPRGGFPPILVGDFNAEPESAEIRYVLGLQSLDGRSMYLRDAWRDGRGEGDPNTWNNRNAYARVGLEPDRRIDYIFVGPPRPDGVGLTYACSVACDRPEGGVWPSDHLGLFAQIHSEPQR